MLGTTSRCERSSRARPMHCRASSPRFGLNQRLSRELRMSKTRISTTVLSGVMRKICKSTGFSVGFFLALRRRCAGAALKSAVLVLAVVLLAVGPVPVSAAAPDPVLEWIDVMNTTVLAAGTAPNVTSRVVALVSASVFDAVNGVEPRFRPLLVKPNAPHNASQRAAAIQAAYAILSRLYPAQSASLTTRLNASLLALALTEKPESIAAGVAWGQTVADAVWTSRLTDGFAPTPPPPFIGVQGVVGTPAVGFRRHTADRHHDALGTQATIAIPPAAAPRPHQPGVRCGSQRSEGLGRPLW